eukprot:7923888-Alexandrium_andersonii.AAC.1
MPRPGSEWAEDMEQALQDALRAAEAFQSEPQVAAVVPHDRVLPKAMPRRPVTPPRCPSKRPRPPSCSPPSGLLRRLRPSIGRGG